ncbi:NTP pyrophosphohydrolase [Staphylococcus haemolyticus]|uniref:NTP pyrophosphohydrolase n=1 Tax=Staphylococcus haemolyticus TaxID=1283 RepID=UPI001F0B49D7|nr:NTP pyrophosphohydrolase [Staphylococcus haemolyticus]MCH4501254.1 NTP pyrophosphohydrolase [Staphylococcus haemolyticus]
MFQQIKKGQIVIDTVTKQYGKVIGREFKNAKGVELLVEVIVNQNKEDNTRTTKLIKVPIMNARPFKPSNEKKKPYAPYFDVKKFHETFGHPVAEVPQPISKERAVQRADYLVEELVEFLWSSVAGNEHETEKLVDELIHSIHKAKNKCFNKGEFPQEEILLNQTDALNDISYINYGSIVETGVNPKPIFEIIQKANMAKLGEDGKPIIDPVTKKIMKPTGWEAKHKPEPLIAKEIKRQIEHAERKRGY